MANLVVNGQKVTVDDSFMSLSPDQQNATVDEIAKSMGTPASPATAQPAPAQQAAAPQAAQPAPASATPLFDAFKANALENIRQQEAPAAPVDISANPYRSSLPGPLGQFANTVNASSAGMSQGMTAGWGDELAAGMMTPIDMIRNHTMDAPGQFSKALDASRGILSGQEALNPQAASVGDTVGSLALMGKAPGPVAAAISAPTKMMLRGAVQGGTYGAVNGAGRGDSLPDRLQQAAAGGATGAAFGAVTGKLLDGAVKPNAAPVPSLGDLEAAKNAAYHTADTLGVTYAPRAYDQMVNDLVKQAKADNINPKLHPGAVSVLTDMAKVPVGYSPTLTQMDHWRQIARRDSAGTAADAGFGRDIMNGIDNLINNATNLQVPSGAGPAGAQAINAARAANNTWKKAQTVDALIQNAGLNAGSANSGGNINNATRQQFKTLLRIDPKTGKSAAQLQGFTPAEIKQMQGIVMGATKENVMRFLGNMLKPNAITAGPWALGISQMPALAAIPAGGQLLKYLADTGTAGKANALAAFVARGGRGSVPASLSAPAGRLVQAMPMIAASQGQNGINALPWWQQTGSQQPVNATAQ